MNNYIRPRGKKGQSLLLFYMELVLCAFIVLFTIAESERWVSLFFSLTFIVLITQLLYTLYRGIDAEDIVDFLLLVSIVLLMFLCVLMNATVTFTYFKKMLMFLSTILFFFITAKTPVNRKTVSIIFTIAYVIDFLFIINYFLGNPAYRYGYLSFHFTNPNLTAMWLLNAALLTILSIHYYSNIWFKLFGLGTVGLLCYFIWETSARTSIFAIILFITVSLVLIFKSKPKLNNFWICLLLLSPLLIAFLYFGIIDSRANQWLGFLSSEGKPITSRYTLWKSALASLAAHPILGDYYGISNGTGLSQLHNTHIDILASYGIPVFILVIIYLYHMIAHISRNIRTKFQFLSLLAFFTIIIMGSGEAALVSGGVGLYILSGSLLMLARYDACADAGAEAVRPLAQPPQSHYLRGRC